MVFVDWKNMSNMVCLLMPEELMVFVDVRNTSNRVCSWKTSKKCSWEVCMECLLMLEELMKFVDVRNANKKCLLKMDEWCWCYFPVVTFLSMNRLCWVVCPWD